VDAASDTSTEVGWAGKYKSQMFVPHKFVAVGFDGSLEFVESVAPSGENLFDITVFLHGDDSDVVFFVDPDEKVLGAVVPDTSSVWPVSGHTGSEQKRRNWFIEQKVVVDKLVLFGFGHILQWVVFTAEVASQVGETVDNDFLDSSSFSSAAPWWESETSNGSAGSASGRENVFGVKVLAFELSWVEAGLVFISGLVAVVSGFDDWVKEFFEGFVALFVTSNGANSHDEWMAWVIDSGLDNVIDGETGWGLLGPKPFVHFQGQNVSHMVVMFFEVWVLILSGVSRFVKV